MCTTERHEELKADRARYEARTRLRGWQKRTDGTELELRNCSCGSTLSDGTTRPIQRRSAPMAGASGMSAPSAA
jgi:hypothetical protein